MSGSTPCRAHRDAADLLPAPVNAVVLFRVIDPIKSSCKWRTSQWRPRRSPRPLSLRSPLGRADLDTLLAHRDDLNEDLAKTIAAQTMPWGVELRVVEIKDVEIREAMQRAMAREPEAKPERRAKIIIQRHNARWSSPSRCTSWTRS